MPASHCQPAAGIPPAPAPQAVPASPPSARPRPSTYLAAGSAGRSPARPGLQGAQLVICVATWPPLVAPLGVGRGSCWGRGPRRGRGRPPERHLRAAGGGAEGEGRSAGLPRPRRHRSPGLCSPAAARPHLPAPAAGAACSRDGREAWRGPGGRAGLEVPQGGPTRGGAGALGGQRGRWHIAGAFSAWDTGRMCSENFTCLEPLSPRGALGGQPGHGLCLGTRLPPLLWLPCAPACAPCVPGGVCSVGSGSLPCPGR